MKKANNFKSLCLVFALMSLPLTIHAQGPDGPRDRNGPPPHNDPGRAVLHAIDANGDHEISAEEISNATNVLKAMDVNGDGVLTHADLAATQNQLGKDRGSRGGYGGPPRSQGRVGNGLPPRREGAGQNGPPGPERMVRHAMEYDTDGDGKLDSTELLRFAEQNPPPRGPRRLQPPPRENRGPNRSQGNRPQR